ncbi:helix-turn-helix domain-containing protein [Gracilimonas sediminicola]|uniref:Helix-turn-helix domain-containing protein n=1 Tax=Gracilimonas sediminicola TaxID=2952158 RepID=A0A9X2L1G7_9BACT|nr:helix-turn-helix domain-containing protein [Gracilimonas sediminicola]MCP9290537.1 helix-turn-helix domain-containing protein [Gracilimonas sediminicola]
MEVICLETEAFYTLIDTVVERLESQSPDIENKWIDTEEAMSLLGIKSKTTLQKYRDNGDIRFTQPRKKIILYDRDSILDFLEGNAKETF